MLKLRRMLVKRNWGDPNPEAGVDELLEEALELVALGVPAGDVAEGLGFNSMFGFYLVQELRGRTLQAEMDHIYGEDDATSS